MLIGEWDYYDVTQKMLVNKLVFKAIAEMPAASRSTMPLRSANTTNDNLFHFHDLRHTFASHLVMAGVDITTVSKLLGHKSLIMTLRYSHLAPNHLQNALNMLNLTGEEKPTAYLLHSMAAN